MAFSKLRIYLAVLLLPALANFTSALPFAEPEELSPYVLPVGVEFQSTKLCDGDKINVKLLNSFDPSKPPSAEVLKDCDPLFAKLIAPLRSSPTGTGTVNSAPQNGPTALISSELRLCSKANQARRTDTLIAALHILARSHLYGVITTNGRREIVQVWGNARISYVVIGFFPTPERTRDGFMIGIHDVARSALWFVDNCFQSQDWVSGNHYRFYENMGYSPGSHNIVVVDNRVHENW